MERKTFIFITILGVLLFSHMSIWAEELPHSNWAAQSIRSGIQLGFVPDELQQEYRRNVTREEFAKMAVSSLYYALHAKNFHLDQENNILHLTKTKNEKDTAYEIYLDCAEVREEEDVSKINGLQMEVTNEMPTGLILQFTKTGEDKKEFIWGDDYWLDKKENGIWIPCKDENWGVDSIGYGFSDTNIQTQAVNWQRRYGSLPEGTYRIRKEILDFRKAGDFHQYNVAAEFVIT